MHSLCLCHSLCSLAWFFFPPQKKCPAPSHYNKIWQFHSKYVMTPGLTNRVLEWYLKQSRELNRLALHCYCASFQHFFIGLAVSLGKDFYNLADPQCQKSFQEMVSHEVKRGGEVTFPPIKHKDSITFETDPKSNNLNRSSSYMTQMTAVSPIETLTSRLLWN